MMEVLLAQSMLKKGHKADQSTLAELVFTCSTLGLHGGGHSVEHKEAVETFNDVIMKYLILKSVDIFYFFLNYVEL